MKRTFLLLIANLLVTFCAFSQFSTLTTTEQLPITSNTQDKSQSKTFEHDGKLWAVLPNSSGTHLWRVDGTTWTHIARLTTKTGSRADCKVSGNLVHIFMFQGTNSQFVTLEYEPSTATYKPWSQNPSTVNVTLDSGVETANIDLDGTGRMWLASDISNAIHVRWSDAPYSQWSSPITVATGLTSNDKGAVVALPGKVGVFWSNQNTRLFGFRTHLDGAAPTSWTSDEMPGSQSALNVGAGMADDHFNMAVASDGTLYAAIKTSYNNADYPLIGLLVRRPNGNWDNLYDVSRTGTTPTVLLNESLGKVKVLYTSQTYGKDIVYRESSTSNINFGSQHMLLSGSAFRDQSSTKQNYSGKVLIIASNNINGYVVGVVASDGETIPAVPSAPALASPENGAIDISVSPILAWQSAQRASSYQLQVATSSNFSSTLFDESGLSATSHTISGLAHNTIYYWRVRASNQAGNSNWSSVWSFTTEAGSTPPTSGLVGHWRMNEGSGARLTDDSGNDNHATLRDAKSVTWTQGVEGMAINLPGTTNRFATVASNTSLSITEAITIAAWVRPTAKRDQTVLSKVYPNGYELGITSTAKALFWINYESHHKQYRVTSNASVPTNGTTWMHLAATYDGRSVSIYINGELDQTVSFPANVPIGTNNSSLSIGALGSIERWKGGIDDLRLYNRALSAAEIMGLVNSNNILASQSQNSMMQAKERSLVEEEAEGRLLVYPNPLSSHATLRFTVPEDGEYSITLYDSKGTSLGTLRNGTAQAGERGELTIDGTKLARGLYFVRMQTPHNKHQSVKLLIEK